MTEKQMIALFNRDDGAEFLEDDHIKPERRLNPRSDLSAFLLLDKLVPSNRGEDIVCAADHDQIFLVIDLKKLAKAATEEDILDLIRCGVIYDEDSSCLAMFA